MNAVNLWAVSASEAEEETEGDSIRYESPSKEF